MMLFNPPILVMILFPILLIIVGFILSQCIDRLHDTTIAAVCLFVFAPALMFYQGTQQAIEDFEFMMVLFFILFHTGILLTLAHQTIKLFKVKKRMRNIYLLNILIVNIFSLRGIQPFLGDPVQAVQTINIFLFFQLLLTSTFGIFLSIDDDDGLLTKTFYVFKSPLLYVLILGLIVSTFDLVLPFEILSIIDSMFKTTLHIGLLLTGILFSRYVFFASHEGNNSNLFFGIVLCLIFRLLISPLVATLVTSLMGFENTYLQRNLILASAAPTGLFAVILISFYGRVAEKRFTVLTLLISSVLGYGTLFIWHSILSLWLPLEG